MTVHVVPLAILVAYALLTIVVANSVFRKRLGSDHFLVAGRALPLSLVIAVVLGDWVGGASTVGVCQRGYTQGLSGSMYSISLGVAMFVFASTMAGRFRKLRAMTIPEVIGRLFDHKTRLTAAAVIAIAYFFIGITQIIAGGALLSSLIGTDKWIGDLVTALIFTIIILSGGLKSIALVNVIQIFVIFGGMMLTLTWSLALIGGTPFGGMARLAAELPPSAWSLLSDRPLFMAGEVLGTVFTCFAAQAAITGIFAARDHKTAVTGSWIVGFLLVPIGIAFAMIGMCARVHFGDALPGGLSAAPAMMLALPPAVAGIALCGLFAAIVSTGPLNFLAPVQIAVRDFYSVHINPDASDQLKLVVSRLLAVVLLFAGWMVAVTYSRILSITYWAFGFRAGIAVVVLSLTYLGARRVSEDGAFGGLICGVIAFVVWSVAGSPLGIHVTIPTMMTVFIATLVISRFRKRRTGLSQEVHEALYGR